MTEYYFKTESMSAGYHGRPVVKDMEIRLNKGEILTLIGPNGAGKSTVLKSIARQLALIGGTVYLDKKDMAAMSGQELSRKMAVVFTPKLRTELMTCEDVAAAGRYPYTGHFGILSSSDYDVVKEAMELVHVTEIKDRDFTKVSDGQRQRVLLARAICQQPEILILDEPVSYLDVKYKLEFLAVLQELRRKKGLTVIMSLHELDLAAKISDKLLCIGSNQVEGFGTPEEIFTSGYMTRLFGISEGSFEEKTQTAELPAPKGKAQLFVIAGAGTGTGVYRSLQRKGIPFMTGILFQNDLDYPVGKALAAEVIEAGSFEPVPAETLRQAKEKMDLCKAVICCRDSFGSLETANQELYRYGRDSGKLIEKGQISYVKGNHDSGYHVKCGEKPSDSRAVQDYETGRFQGRSL